MKNELPIMPIRAMYADKSTEGKDLNKVGSIDPVVIPVDNFTRELLEKAIEVGTFIYDGRVWFVGTVTRSDDVIDMYASTTIDDEFVVRVLNAYTEDESSTHATVETYSRVIPQGGGTKLYQHNINGGNLFVVSTSNQVITSSTQLDMKNRSILSILKYGSNGLTRVISTSPINNGVTLWYLENGTIVSSNSTSSSLTDTVTEL